MHPKILYIIQFTIIVAIVLTIFSLSPLSARAGGLPIAKSGRWVRATVTQYSPWETCPKGKASNCINASGVRPRKNHSLACPRHIRKGSHVLIMGRKYKCDDRTAKRLDGRYDIFVPSHKGALAFGKQKLTIFLYDFPQ